MKCQITLIWWNQIQFFFQSKRVDGCRSVIKQHKWSTRSRAKALDWVHKMETSSEKYGNERSSQDPRPHQLAPFVFFLIFLLIQFIPSLFFRSLLGCLEQQTVLFWWRLWCHSIKPLGANAIFRAFLTPLLSANRTGWDNGRDRHHRGHRHQHSIRRYG